jgi:hypothetical protein
MRTKNAARRITLLAGTLALVGALAALTSGCHLPQTCPPPTSPWEIRLWC